MLHFNFKKFGDKENIASVERKKERKKINKDFENLFKSLMKVTDLDALKQIENIEDTISNIEDNDFVKSELLRGIKNFKEFQYIQSSKESTRSAYLSIAFSNFKSVLKDSSEDQKVVFVLPNVLFHLIKGFKSDQLTPELAKKINAELIVLITDLERFNNDVELIESEKLGEFKYQLGMLCVQLMETNQLSQEKSFYTSKAISIFENLSASENIKATYMLGKISELENESAAIEYYKKALEFASKDSSDHTNLKLIQTLNDRIKTLTNNQEADKEMIGAPQVDEDSSSTLEVESEQTLESSHQAEEKSATVITDLPKPESFDSQDNSLGVKEMSDVTTADKDSSSTLNVESKQILESNQTVQKSGEMLTDLPIPKDIDALYQQAEWLYSLRNPEAIKFYEQTLELITTSSDLSNLIKNIKVIELMTKLQGRIEHLTLNPFDSKVTQRATIRHIIPVEEKIEQSIKPNKGFFSKINFFNKPKQVFGIKEEKNTNFKYDL